MVSVMLVLTNTLNLSILGKPVEVSKFCTCLDLVWKKC